MERKITIIFEKLSVVAILNNSSTANKIWESLPIENSASIWGEEIYFSIPVNDVEENAKSVVDLGDLAFWPPGSAFCLFFGLTPVSSEGTIKPASPVNVIGKVIGDIEPLKSVIAGEKVKIEKV
jgi:hypothetical protein